MKKKFLSKILISVVMIGIFMLPIAPSVKINSEKLAVKITLNQTNAQATPEKVLQEEPDESSVNGIKLNCTVANIGGCVAWLFWVFFRVVSWIAQLAAFFLDYMLYYSINSSSYDNTFVAQGWSAIRDIANMFFIIALLYVAIKTILGLNVTDNKKMIGYVIVVALLLNFSLFTTKVVIDGTNILAKVFYNNAPNLDKNGIDTSEKKDAGEKSISVLLIRTYNPQKMMSQDMYNGKGGVATFIFLVVISIAIILYTAYMFFAVALLFVSRVASLWLLMIFSPIAFASYTVPFDIPGFGHKEWWSELLKNAFLAPIFVFFLYIVATFASFLNNIVKYPPGSSASDFLIQNIMSVILPFIILFVLLMKSKELAITYSGKMGEAFMKFGKMAGGLALGAVTGGAAMLGTKAVGGYAASQLSKHREDWQEKSKEGGFGGWAARMKLRTADYGSKATFDARKTQAGAGLGKISGMDFQSAKLLGLGSKEGGFKGAETRSADKIINKADLYKTKMTDKETKEWSDKRQQEYDAKSPEYKSKNARPKEYTSAGQLNTDRLKSYTENFAGRQLFSKVGNKEATKRLIKTVDQGEKIQGEKDIITERKKKLETTQTETKGKQAEEQEKLKKFLKEMEDEHEDKIKASGQTLEEYISTYSNELKTSMDDLSTKEKSIAAQRIEVEKQIAKEQKKTLGFGSPEEKEETIKKLEVKRNTLQDQETSIRTEFALKMQESAKLEGAEKIKGNLKEFENQLIVGEKAIREEKKREETLNIQAEKNNESTKIVNKKTPHPTTPYSTTSPAKEHTKEEPPHSTTPSGGGAHHGG